ncbi:MAG: cytochrome c oxidase assembly protein, partial [Caldilineaceae bacterium]|nr:cytochrome c oxidase assembly protein [Caldilineaceae bacterium]
TSSLFGRNAHFRRGLSAITRPGIAWLLFIIVYLGWHDASAYNAALRIGWVHDLEHLTFFAAAMLFWWHVVGAAPRVHGAFPVWGRMALAIAVVPFNMMAGVAISFAERPIYTYYESVPRIWGFSVMQDQMLGGIIMWIPGSMMFILATLVLLSNLMKKAEDGNSPHRPNWDSEEAMVAPGLEHRVVRKRWQELNISNGSASDVL